MVEIKFTNLTGAQMYILADAVTEIEKMEAEAPKAPKADAPKADAPKADAPKADAPKADAPKEIKDEDLRMAAKDKISKNGDKAVVLKNHKAMADMLSSYGVKKFPELPQNVRKEALEIIKNLPDA